MPGLISTCWFIDIKLAPKSASKLHTVVNKGNGVLLRKYIGVNWSNDVIFRACTGWNKGNVAYKSHGLSIRVTRVNGLDKRMLAATNWSMNGLWLIKLVPVF